MNVLMRSFALALLLAVGVCLASPVRAALSFELRTGDAASRTQAMIIDSNKCLTEGPSAMYVGGVVRNDGARATNVTVSLSGLNANIFLAGGQATTQNVGTLEAGESIALFWLTGYTCMENAAANPNVVMASSAGTQSQGLTLQIRSAKSANAGGNVLSATLGPGAVVGQTIFFDALYDFGGTDTGDEYFLQPSGSPLFNAACFRLTGSRIISSNVNAAPVDVTDTLYFVQPDKQSGNGYGIGVRYFFQYVCAGASTSARPYAVQTSGGSNLKYTGNFDGAGSISISFLGATNPFTIEKSVSSALDFVGAPGNLIYTITITNPSLYASEISSIEDVLPAGMQFAGVADGSDITADNSSSIPAVGASGTLTFRGRLGRSYALPAGGSAVLRYAVSRPPEAGTFTNTARALFGTATTPTAQAVYEQIEILALEATKVSAVIHDPVRGNQDPLAIPGALIEYAIRVNNPNPLGIDSDSVLVTDRTPTGLKLCLADLGGAGTGPLAFSDGQTAAGLGYTYSGLASATDHLEFSNDGGLSWSYVPAPDDNGCDAGVTAFRVRTSGQFAGEGQFTVRARYLIE